MAGLYQFGLSAVGKADGNGYFCVGMLKNGKMDRRFVGNANANQLYTSVAGSWEMILFEGDIVSLLLQCGSITFQYMAKTDHVHFYGKMVSKKAVHK